LSSGRDLRHARNSKTILFTITGIGSGTGEQEKPAIMETMNLIAALVSGCRFPDKSHICRWTICVYRRLGNSRYQIAAFEFGDKKSITWEGEVVIHFLLKKADEDLLSMEPKAHS